jgi:hypothetical protein
LCRFKPGTSCAISGFRCEVDENCVLGYYAANRGGNSLPMFQENLSVPSSRSRIQTGPLKMGLIGRPKTSVQNYHYSLYTVYSQI